MAKPDPVLHALASQVQEPVLQSQVLPGIVLVFNHEWQGGTLAKNLDIFCLDLYFTCSHVAIDHGVRSSSYFSLYRNTVLKLKFLGLLLEFR